MENQPCQSAIIEAVPRFFEGESWSGVGTSAWWQGETCTWNCQVRKKGEVRDGLHVFDPIGWGWLRTTAAAAAAATTTTTTTTTTTNIGPGNISLKRLNMLSQFGHFSDRLTMHRLHCALATSGVVRFFLGAFFFKAQPPKKEWLENTSVIELLGSVWNIENMLFFLCGEKLTHIFLGESKWSPFQIGAALTLQSSGLQGVWMTCVFLFRDVFNIDWQ